MAYLDIPIEQFSWIGILVIFLLIGISAQAFRLVFHGHQIVWPLWTDKETVTERIKERTYSRNVPASFLGTFVHDMNTPLTNINLFLDLLEAHPTILQDEPELIESMRCNQRALLNAVSNIVDLEMTGSGGALYLNMETFDLVQSIESIANAMKLTAAKKRISIDCQVEDCPLFILADCRLIERVLLNLISNAVKYTQTEGRVTVSAQKKDDIVITVEDNGCGIPSEELPFIFDRFSRVNIHRQNAEGFGLGLAAAKSLVKAHGGEITVTSQLGLGSKFAVRLPVNDRVYQTL